MSAAVASPPFSIEAFCASPRYAAPAAAAPSAAPAPRLHHPQVRRPLRAARVASHSLRRAAPARTELSRSRRAMASPSAFPTTASVEVRRDSSLGPVALAAPRGRARRTSNTFTSSTKSEGEAVRVPITA